MKLSEISKDNQSPQDMKLSDIGGDSTLNTVQQPSLPTNRFQVSLNNLNPNNGQDYSNSSLGILQDIISHPIQNRGVISDAISNSGKQISNNLADLGDSTINGIKSIPQIPTSILQSVLHPILAAKSVGGAIGNKINQYSTMDKVAEKVSQEPLGFGSDVVNSALLAKGLINAAPEIAKLKVPMPKAYNDALITKTGQSIVSKVQGAVQPLKEQYKSLIDPFANKPVDNETFQKALSVVPADVQKGLIEKYGSAVLDSNGKPQTTLGNLQAMELGLKDDILQPKYGQSINAESYDIAKATKQIKDIRLSQYPQDTKNAILELDKKFGPVINMSTYLLPKVSNKAGAINTKALYQIFNNPTDAGTRSYLSSLKSLGVDLTPEMGTLKGWVGRQRTKSFIKSMTGKAVEGGAIGTILKSGTSG